MKKYIQTLLFAVITYLGACTYSKNDIAYFEASIPSLETMLELSKEQTRKMRNKTLKKIRRTQFSYSAQKISYQAKSKQEQLETTLGKHRQLDNYLHTIQQAISSYLLEKESHKSMTSLNFIDKKTHEEMDSVVNNYITFLENNYPKQRTTKIKVWLKQRKNFTEYQFEGLPLIAVLAQFFQIRIALEEQTQLICEMFYQEALAQQQEVKEYLACVLSEEKNKVKLGEAYKARVVVIPHIEVPDMKMKIAGQEVPVKNGVGKLKIKPQELGKKTWKGSVSFRLWEKDTSFHSETKYYEVIPKE